VAPITCHSWQWSYLYSFRYHDGKHGKKNILVCTEHTSCIYTSIFNFLQNTVAYLFFLSSFSWLKATVKI
jgi:hypothetical protein